MPMSISGVSIASAMCSRKGKVPSEGISGMLTLRSTAVITGNVEEEMPEISCCWILKIRSGWEFFSPTMRGWLEEMADVEQPESAAAVLTKVSTPSTVIDRVGMWPCRTVGRGWVSVGTGGVVARRTILLAAVSGPNNLGSTK